MRSLRSINAAFFARSKTLRGAPLRGSPTLRAAPPPPPKAPQRGVNRPPKGRGRAAPLSALRAPLRPPWGTPAGFPRLRRLPLLLLFGNERGWQAKRAGAERPGEGLEKNQSGGADRGRQAASGGNVGKVGQSVGRGGGSRWAAPGLSTGCPCLCPRTGEAARRSRSDLHISTARGSSSAPSGGLFCPAGLTTSVQEV